jgi:hypothetical protein
VRQDDLGSAILFANHTRSQFRPMDGDMCVAASNVCAVEFLDRADREQRVSWAHRARKGRIPAAYRSWKQLNGFLRKHGLNPVSEGGLEYTTGDARQRVADANPGLRVFS